MEIRVNKGKVGFVYVDKGEDQYYSQFGYLKGTSKWTKVLQPDQYGNYAVDVYPSEDDLNHIKDIATEIANDAKELVEGAGKQVKMVNDVSKFDQEDVEYIQFKRKASKQDGSDVPPPKIYDAGGTHVADWNKLVGNGSTVKVGYTLTPYYMAATKTVGVSFKFYAIQIIKLSEYTGGTGGGSGGFGDETDSNDAPFDGGEDF